MRDHIKNEKAASSELGGLLKYQDSMFSTHRNFSQEDCFQHIGSLVFRASVKAIVKSLSTIEEIRNDS